jgi:hypothetical protein
MFDVHKRVQEIQTDHGYTWTNQCFRLPVVQVDVLTINAQKNVSPRQKRDDDFFHSFNDWDDNDFFLDK